MEADGTQRSTNKVLATDKSLEIVAAASVPGDCVNGRGRNEGTGSV